MFFERILVWSEVALVWDGLIRGDFKRDLNLGHIQAHTQTLNRTHKHKLKINAKIA